MKSTDWFTSKLEAFKEDFEFRFETLILDLTENICKRMAHENISRTEFAKRLSVSPPAVTKILNGNSNFTLKTLLSIADALGQELSVDFKEKEVIASHHLEKAITCQPFASSEDEFAYTRATSSTTDDARYMNLIFDSHHVCTSTPVMAS